ncbi:MAG TPA: hypothetical protein VG028_13415 [Terriglobia bacterium]|nr:hypothetical protein [Terriglobia bacterium]
MAAAFAAFKGPFPVGSDARAIIPRSEPNLHAQYIQWCFFERERHELIRDVGENIVGCAVSLPEWEIRKIIYTSISPMALQGSSLISWAEISSTMPAKLAEKLGFCADAMWRRGWPQIEWPQIEKGDRFYKIATSFIAYPDEMDGQGQ